MIYSTVISFLNRFEKNDEFTRLLVGFSLFIHPILWWKYRYHTAFIDAGKFLTRKLLQLPEVTKGSLTFDLKNFQGKNGIWRSNVDEKMNQKIESCQFQVVNELLNKRIILCWVNNDGKLYHHYVLNDKSIVDKSVSNKHLENTMTTHCFVAFLENGRRPSTVHDIIEEDFIFAYVPYEASTIHTIKIGLTEMGKYDIHLLFEDIDNSNVIDNCNKQYHKSELSGFCVQFEENITREMRDTLQSDLNHLVELLPAKAVKVLQKDTAIYVNKSLTYGTEKRPVVGKGGCYHEMGTTWLKQNGLNSNKAGCIEIYNEADYLSSRHYWGDGGLLVHEMSHAYHNKFCPNGFDNVDILNAYKDAMTNKLYDAVNVHGPQGVNGAIKAYACANHKEYFAELSTAYAWSKDETTEYNKWYPFNRSQLKKHDPKAYDVLEKVWNLER